MAGLHLDLPLLVAGHDVGLSYIASSRGLPADEDHVSSEVFIAILANKPCGHNATPGCYCTTMIDSTQDLCQRCKNECGAQTAAHQGG